MRPAAWRPQAAAIEQAIPRRGCTRRQFTLAAAAGVVLASIRPGTASAAGNAHSVRLAQASRSMDTCLAWLGSGANLFLEHGVRLDYADGGGTNPLAALFRGDCEFAQAGVEAVARGVLEGHDPVLILSPVESHRAGSLLSRADLRTPEQLAGANVGVPNESGASAISARMILQNWGVNAKLVSLGSPAAAYAALGEGKVDAAYLPVELGLRGRRQFGWNMFEGGMLGVPGGLVTTRRYLAANRKAAAAVVTGFVDAIRLFKTRRDAVLPLLQRYLQIDDRQTVEELHELYLPLFRSTPNPSLFFAASGLRDGLSARYAAAKNLQPSDLIDASLVDELSRSGYIARLYAAVPTRMTGTASL